jgi:hypothetical protein
MTPMNKLSQLLATERAIAPPAHAEQQGLARLLESLAVHAAPLPVVTGSLRLARFAAFKWLSVGFAVGISGAGAASVVLGPATVAEAPSVVVSAAVAHSAIASPPADIPLPAAVSSVEPELLRAPSCSLSASAPHPVAAPSQSPTFDEELRLITNAKQELDAGRPHLAQVWLSEHQQRFAGGVFALEREALSIAARCSQQPDPALAQGFALRHPASPMLAQLRRKCGERGPTGAPASSSENFSDPTNAPATVGEPTNNTSGR